MGLSFAPLGSWSEVTAPDIGSGRFADEAVAIDPSESGSAGARLARVVVGALLGGVLALGAAGVLRTPPAIAAPLAVVEGEALDVTAERLEVDVERGTALLQGNVSLTFGEIEIRCPKVEIRYDRSPRVSFAKGTGGVTARLKGTEATAEAIEFDATSRKVLLSGAVRLTRGRGWMRAERATLDIASGKVSLEDVKGSIPIEAPKR
jgi:lipopolysaccharide transport protein LptA